MDRVKEYMRQDEQDAYKWVIRCHPSFFQHTDSVVQNKLNFVALYNQCADPSRGPAIAEKVLRLKRLSEPF
jgi:hypothetical protein